MEQAKRSIAAARTGYEPSAAATWSAFRLLFDEEGGGSINLVEKITRNIYFALYFSSSKLTPRPKANTPS